MVFISILYFYHCKIILRAQTTNENLKPLETKINPNDLGSKVANLKAVFCKKRKMSLIPNSLIAETRNLNSAKFSSNRIEHEPEGEAPSNSSVIIVRKPPTANNSHLGLQDLKVSIPMNAAHSISNDHLDQSENKGSESHKKTGSSILAGNQLSSMKML